MKILDTLWESYAGTIPDNASAIQRQETQKAFVAGVFGLLSALQSLPEDEDDSVLILEELDTDCRLFFDKFKTH